jgi:8-oxo-dGTP diphosphatase
MAQKSEHFPDSFYRVSVKGLFVKDGKVLLLKESPKLSGQWELPGGGLDFGEDIHVGLKREIEEEMGLKVKSISDKPVYVWTWRFENKRNMDWYYSLVLAYRIELGSLDFKPTEECEGIEFFSKEELESIELCWQTNGLKKVFHPEDFL